MCLSVKSGKDVLCVQHTIIIRSGCCVSLEDMMCVFQCTVLGRMLCVFQCTVWNGCCVCFSAQFRMDAVCVSAQDSRRMAGEGAKR